MLKRTCHINYSCKDSRADAQAARMAGVVDGQQDLMGRFLGRDAREKKYETKRTANARMSGFGARECERRAARGQV